MKTRGRECSFIDPVIEHFDQCIRERVLARWSGPGFEAARDDGFHGTVLRAHCRARCCAGVEEDEDIGPCHCEETLYCRSIDRCMIWALTTGPLCLSGTADPSMARIVEDEEIAVIIR